LRWALERLAPLLKMVKSLLKGDWDPVTCPWHVTYEQFCALPPLLIVGAKINGQMPWTVHGYSILILAVYFQPNGPDRKAPNCSSVTCPWHVTGSQSVEGAEGILDGTLGNWPQ
jgi:hypothetical protein